MSYWRERITIKNLSIPRFIGGPLDGITDAPFRRLVREFSTQELLYTEMRHVGCVANDATGRLSLDFQQSERPINYQISASSIEFIDKALEKILSKGVDSIDLNIGCPARNVIKSGSGCALMADLPRLKKILDHLRVRLSIPLTIKIRAGFKIPNAVDVARLAQDCGVDALTIHPRLQAQLFAGRPDYALAAQVKKALSIPVFLSGNVINWQTACLAYEQTGVDGFLIGRGIWAKPWKLKELDAHANGQAFDLSPSLIFGTAFKHFEYMLAHYGHQGLYQFRKHIPLYLRGLSDASLLRRTLVVSNSVDEVKMSLLALAGR